MNIEALSDREKEYFNSIRNINGELYITAKVGVAKSNIAKSIADKMGWEYIDLRMEGNDHLRPKPTIFQMLRLSKVLLALSKFLKKLSKSISKFAYKLQ